jgi:hypothetical protein
MSEQTVSIMSKDIMSSKPQDLQHRLSNSKKKNPKGLSYCNTCKVDVVCVLQYTWCGTEPFAFCPRDPEIQKNETGTTQIPEEKKSFMDRIKARFRPKNSETDNPYFFSQ